MRLLKIAHDNEVLVKRLTEINRHAPDWARQLEQAAPCNVASSAVNRRKAASTIAQVRFRAKAMDIICSFTAQGRVSNMRCWRPVVHVMQQTKSVMEAFL